METPEKWRILHLIPWAFSGGVETRRLQLLKHLPKDRFEQRILCLRGMGPLLVEIQEHAVLRMKNTPKRWKYTDLEAMSWIAGQIDEWKPHVVHGAVFEGTVMAGVCGTFSDTPKIVLEETGDPAHFRSWRANLLLRTLARLSDACVGVSAPVTEYWKELGVPENKIFLIENGVEPIQKVPHSAAMQLRQTLGIPNDAFVIGSAGRIHDSHKRFSDLIKALSLLKTKRDVHLLIVGRGADEQVLRDLAAELGVSDRVHLPGYHYDLTPFYSAMDVFALLSEQESFGLVVAEAMFCELPVVATRVGGMQFVVEEGTTGLLVPAYNPQAAARALTLLIDDLPTAQAMGKAGRKRAIEKYSSIRYVRDVEAMYHQLLT